jgi:hypothetical protein
VLLVGLDLFQAPSLKECTCYGLKVSLFIKFANSGGVNVIGVV